MSFKCFTKFIFLLAATILFNYGCKKNEINENSSIAGIDEGTIVNTSFSGRVLNENEEGINGVEIVIGNKRVFTDNTGYYFIPNVSTKNKHAFIKATKFGYFKSGKTLEVKANVVNNVSIYLVEKKLKGVFKSNQNSEVLVNDGASILFNTNSIINAKTNQIYNGVVKVYAYYLNPKKPKALRTMPGNLLGVNNNRLQSLLSFGMMAVELEDENGNELNIAKEKNATLKCTIDASLTSNAPSEIDLWYFDENKGLWQIEGKAVKENNIYKGEVKHFSWWNCDYGGGPITLTLRLTTKNNQPVTDVFVKISNANSFGVGGGSGYSASDGTITANIPSNTSIRLIINGANICGTSLLLDSILGSYSTNVNIGDIFINTPAYYSISINANLTNCNNQPISNGMASIIINNFVKKYQPIINGKLNFSSVFCFASTIQKLQIIATDYSNQYTDTIITTSILDTGTININKPICNRIIKKINYQTYYTDEKFIPLSNNSIIKFVFNNDSILTKTNGGMATVLLPANTLVIRNINAISLCGTSKILVDTFFTPAYSSYEGQKIIDLKSGVQITGFVNSCDNLLLENGNILAAFKNGTNLSANVFNGYFEIFVPFCIDNSNNSFTLTAIDEGKNLQNDTSPQYTLSNNFVGTYNIGSIKACGISTTEFINYTVYGSPNKLIPNRLIQNDLGVTSFSGYSNQAPNFGNFDADFLGTTVGTFNLNARIISGNYTFKTNTANASKITVTSYGIVNNFVTADFSGTFYDSLTNLMAPVSGSLRIRRSR
jgi:hypothetical protein